MIKRISTTFNNIIDGEIVDSYLIEISSYTLKHDLLKSTTLDEEGNPLITELFEYDHKDRIIHQTVLDYELNTEFRESFQYQNDLIVEHLEHFSDDKYFRSVNEYNSLGDILSITKTDQHNSLVNKITYQYSSDGYQQRNYDENNQLMDELFVKKDAKGNEISSIWIDLNNDPPENFRTTYEYNELDQLILEKQYEGNRETSIRNNLYDTHGNLIKSKCDEPYEEFTTIIYYQYDGQNNVILLEKYENDVLRYKEENKYNIEGDLIEMFQNIREDIHDSFMVKNQYISEITKINN